MPHDIGPGRFRQVGAGVFIAEYPPVVPELAELSEVPADDPVFRLIRVAPANIGYMSGALKHFFDGIYYPCLEATRRRPYGLYVHGNLDTGGAVRAVKSITTGLQWRAVRPPACVTGTPGKQDLQACWELGALLAVEIAE